MRRMFDDERGRLLLRHACTTRTTRSRRCPEGVREGVLRGSTSTERPPRRRDLHVRCSAAARSSSEVLARAGAASREHFGVSADVWSAHELPAAAARGARSASAGTACTPTDEPRALVAPAACSTDVEGPFIAASDLHEARPRPDRAAGSPGTFVPLGTDGFGMSDTREALRRHFEIDESMVVVAALDALRKDGKARRRQRSPRPSSSWRSTPTSSTPWTSEGPRVISGLEDVGRDRDLAAHLLDTGRALGGLGDRQL